MNIKTGLAALLGLFLFVPASAEIAINEMVINKAGENMNVRIVLGNPSSTVQKGPITMVLYARKDAYSTWQKIKVWTDVTEIKSGDKVARDIFGANSPLMRSISATPSWEARAWASAAGAPSVSLNVVARDQVK